jgi:hypothetical protein
MSFNRYLLNRHARACRGHPRLNCAKDMDGRNKSGHDERFGSISIVPI